MESFYAFALPKAGSSLLESILFDISTLSGHTTFTPTVTLFEHGIKEEDVDIDQPNTFEAQGYCFSGFRHAPPFLSSRLLENRKAILLVRDPRDMLVSMYFSMRYSHVEPGPGAYRDWFLAQRKSLADIPIDRFAAGVAQDLNATLEAMLGLLRHANIRLYRYEDVIYRKQQWIEDIVSFLGLTLDNAALAGIAAKYDTLPAGENVNSHYRQGHPGDGERKLEPTTLMRIGRMLAPQWQWLGYPTEQPQEALAQSADVVARLIPPSPSASITCTRLEGEIPDGLGPALARASHPGTISLKTGRAEILSAHLATRIAEDGTKRLAYSYIVAVGPVAEELIFGCRMVNERGGVFFGRNSLALNQPPLHFPEGGTLCITWDLPHPVPPGLYRFSAGCSYANNPTNFIAREVDAFQAALPQS
ncbi:sulfotransferase domain-containing protein [Ferrovibrio sp. MS7]|uniref:sulfotransferase domain-containing protein n=1 Tax=Ferrovibrio plantarum TaxID=3119164 RepID=UPI003137489B